MSRCASRLKVVNSFFPGRFIETKKASYFFVETGRVWLDAVALASHGIIAVALLYGFKHVMLISVIRIIYGICHLLERVVNSKGKMTVFFSSCSFVVQVVRTKSVKGVIVLKMHDTTGYMNFHQSDVPLIMYFDLVRHVRGEPVCRVIGKVRNTAVARQYLS